MFAFQVPWNAILYERRGGIPTYAPLMPKRKTIGVLVDWTTERYQQTFLNGIVDFALAHDLHCICFEGGGLASPNEFESQNNNNYRIPNGELVDGLVIFSATIAHFVGQQEMKTFCSQYRPLPLVSVGMEIEGIPSLLVDNRTGMQENVRHLIEEHRFRKFALLTGKKENRDAVERFEAFKDTLREYGIPLDPSFVFEGNFTVDLGASFARTLPDPSNLDVDAIICANDNMALGAMEGLTRRGIRIPEQMAITGFDNIDISGFASPALTTVQLPIYQLGQLSAQRLLDQIEGRRTEDNEVVPTRAVIRESCRCHSTRLFILPGTPGSTGIIKSEDRKSQAAPIEPLAGGEEFLDTQRMLCELWNQRSFSDVEKRSAEDERFQQVMEASQQIVRKRWQKTQDFLLENNIVTLMRELLTAATVTRQMELIARHLPDFSIDSCYLSFYQGQTGYNEDFPLPAARSRRGAPCT